MNTLFDTNEYKKEKQKSEVKDILIFFGENFQQKYGSKYFCSFGKDTKLVKELLKSFSVEEIKKRIHRFFLRRDNFVETSGYTIGIFYTRFNSLAREQFLIMPNI